MPSERSSAVRSGAPRPRSAASCAAPPWRPTIEHLIEPARRADWSALAMPAHPFQRPGAAKVQTRPAARPLPAGFPADRRPVGQPDGAHQHGVFFREHAARPGDCALSQPGGRDRIAASAGDLERDRAGESGAAGHGTGRGSAAGQSAGPSRGFPVPNIILLPIDECYKLVD